MNVGDRIVRVAMHEWRDWRGIVHPTQFETCEVVEIDGSWCRVRFPKRNRRSPGVSWILQQSLEWQRMRAVEMAGTDMGSR